MITEAVFGERDEVGGEPRWVGLAQNVAQDRWHALNQRQAAAVSCGQAWGALSEPLVLDAGFLEPSVPAQLVAETDRRMRRLAIVALLREPDHQADRQCQGRAAPREQFVRAHALRPWIVGPGRARSVIRRCTSRPKCGRTRAGSPRDPAIVAHGPSGATAVDRGGGASDCGQGSRHSMTRWPRSHRRERRTSGRIGRGDEWTSCSASGSLRAA